MDNINKGFQVMGGDVHIGNLAMGDQARVISTTRASEVPNEDRESGRAPQPVAPSRSKVFVCYSHRDAKWLQRLRVHLKPLEQKGLIKLWDDSKIAVGTKWKEEIEAAIQSSTIALLLVSADFLASDFITEFELPKLLTRAEADGATIMPLIVAPCLFKHSEISVFQAHNPPDKPLSTMVHSEQEQTLVKLAEAISRKLTEV